MVPEYAEVSNLFLRPLIVTEYFVPFTHPAAPQSNGNLILTSSSPKVTVLKSLSSQVF
jgi:hypothetical protein